MANPSTGIHEEPDQIKGISRGLGPGPGPWGQAGQPGQGPRKPLDLMGICSDFKARTGIYGLKGPFPGLSPWAQGPGP